MKQHLKNLWKRSALKRILMTAKYIIGFFTRIITSSLSNHGFGFYTTIKYFSPDDFQYAPVSAEEIRNDRKIKKEISIVLFMAMIIAILILTTSFNLMAQKSKIDSLRKSPPNPFKGIHYNNTYTFRDTSKVIMLVSDSDVSSFSIFNHSYSVKGYLILSKSPIGQQIFLDENKNPIEKRIIVWLMTKREW